MPVKSVYIKVSDSSHAGVLYKEVARTMGLASDKELRLAIVNDKRIVGFLDRKDSITGYEFRENALVAYHRAAGWDEDPDEQTIEVLIAGEKNKLTEKPYIAFSRLFRFFNDSTVIDMKLRLLSFFRPIMQDPDLLS